jgi:hypothetical protein
VLLAALERPRWTLPALLHRINVAAVGDAVRAAGAIKEGDASPDASKGPFSLATLQEALAWWAHKGALHLAHGVSVAAAAAAGLGTQSASSSEQLGAAATVTVVSRPGLPPLVTPAASASGQPHIGGGGGIAAAPTSAATLAAAVSDYGDDDGAGAGGGGAAAAAEEAEEREAEALFKGFVTGTRLL